MTGFFAFLLVMFIANTSFANPVVDFIEFTPIAAVSSGYDFGTSEIKIDNKTFYTLSFKKGKNVFALVPEDMIDGVYPILEYTGLAINNSLIIVGGVENKKNGSSWVFLFQVQKDRIALLDILRTASINNYVFNFDYDLPNIHAPKAIENTDKDKQVEFGLNFYDLGVTIYIEVENNLFNIDYSSSQYNKIFNQLDIIDEKDDYQFMQYLVYGTLARRLNSYQAEKMYSNYLRESNYKLKQVIMNMRRIKELSIKYNVVNNVMEYLMHDLEQEILFETLSNIKDTNEFKQRVLLLDEQLKLLKIDEVILNDFSTYIGGYLDDREFEDLLTRAVTPLYMDVKVMLSNILILNNILHKYGYKMIYLRASI